MISLVASVSTNGTIGLNNTLPWRQVDDLKRFKMLTKGHTVVMGRKTYESIGRPLPMRHNVVLTRQGMTIPGVQVIHSLLEIADIDDSELFIIGGFSLYEYAITKADRLYITEIHAQVEGDTIFPAIDASVWREVRREPSIGDGEENQYDTDFVVYDRR